MNRPVSREGFPCRSGWRGCFRSILFKSSVLVVAMVLAVTSVGTLIGLRAMKTVLLENECARVVQLGDAAAAVAAPEVAARHRAELARRATQLVNDGRFMSVMFVEPGGQVLASRASEDAALLCPTLRGGLVRPLIRACGERLCVEATVPVRGSTGLHAGYMRFVSDITPAQIRLDRVAARMWRTALLGTLLLVPCCLVVTRRAIAPIHDLVAAARAIANGTMDARARVHARDEIGTLAESFNTMAGRIAESQLELLKLNAELEERVQRRTQDLEELASRDPLTGVYNRRYFGEVIAREFASAERYGDDLTCLMFDVDHFKLINDQFGHRTGDGILVAVASAITRELRGSDVAARFGGDEFILLLPQTSANAASALADRVVNAFHEEVAATYPGVRTTLSIGVASLRTTRAPSSEALIHEADVALYAAKEGGRNRLMHAAGEALIR